MTAPWSVGTGRADITAYEPGTALFGWGHPDNLARGVAMPLYARAVVVTGGGRRVALVCCDLGLVSQSVRQAVEAELPALGLDPAATLIGATHTHSGPSGLSRYMYYAVAGPGFSERVHDHVVRGILDALAQAVGSLRPGRARLAAAPLPAALGIAWNRSPRAHNRNPDVRPVRAGDASAVNRRMVVLRLEEEDARLRAIVAWLPLHGTCIHADNTLLHPDHKGVAAARTEERAAREGASPDFVALFPQEAAGDVTPNAVPDPRRGVVAGPLDDFAHAERTGAIQAHHAWALAAEARRAEPEPPTLGGALVHVDFAHAPVDPRHAGGREGLHTAPARLGLAFAHGTDEGPGPLHGAQWLNRLARPLADARRRVDPTPWKRAHGGKVAGWDLGHGADGRILSVLPSMNPVMRRIPDPRVRWYCEAWEVVRRSKVPWAPHVLPAQVLRLGSLVIAGVPVEPTTVAGRRLAAAVRRAPTETVVVQGYANAYASYLTTPEEYGEQHYEAASTLFGQWSLPAWATALDRVRDALDAGRPLDGPTPRRFGPDDALPPMPPVPA